ncbi:electron transport complex subunit RsxD [Teredinibacter haidensis]|uniref:electron transport complex subunit RsxD n=1 Tax=Teredinibacter haidensis TaxID=2731755 RepID=UPI000948CE41|nr:electron transport complex subunit RsxD [Teredinibacter haidensis]
MAFIKVTSPHAHRPGNTGTVMKTVLLATVPGIAVITAFFGPGTLLNIVLASLFCLVFEAAFLKLRNKTVAFYLQDYSALLTAVLLALTLPPYAPWWLVATGCFFAIVVAKQLYGGLGYNPFNPAMVGYIVLLISFPLEMSQWPAAVSALSDGQSLPSISQTLQQVFLGNPIDGYTAATPLDVLKQNNSLELNEVYKTDAGFIAGYWAGAGWEWANLAFLLGGAFLLYKKVFTWHAPIAMLTSLSVLSALFYDGGSSGSTGSPLFHLFSGATMLGAFFIVTDPVTSAVSNKGRLIYGALIGVLLFVIRAWGNYPDALAFSVLLLNFAAPFIDYYTKPKTYGHKAG